MADLADLADRAKAVLKLLDRRDEDGICARSPRIRGLVDRGWSLTAYLEAYTAGLDHLAGPYRTVRKLSSTDTIVRYTVDGVRGRAYVTIRFDDDGWLDGFSVDSVVLHGIANIVVSCRTEDRERLARFYQALLGEFPWRRPLLVFGDGREYRPPRWPDPAYPQQRHLDVLVGDLDAGEALVVANGATAVQDHGHYRIYIDPVGHPFCLYQDPVVDAPPGVLARVVFDCSSPRALASFYAELLDMPNRVEDTPDRVVIASADNGLPMLGFQHAPQFTAPRWPDPAYPQQMHFDLKFDDRRAKQQEAERLGAMPLKQLGSCPVYADPAGHPFCLCYPAE